MNGGPLMIPWSEDLAEYNFGPTHPLAPIRVQLALQLARELGVLDGIEFVSDFASATDAQLLRVHTPELIAAVKEASDNPHYFSAEHGLGTSDDPVFPHMHRAAARVAGATTAAAVAVWTGQVEHAVNLAGGLHHAHADASSGFCVYNDIAVAIAELLDRGAQRVAYIDIDAHHGDGVQDIFWNDPRVLTISIHESARTLFPGSGYPTETGGPDAPGSAVNIALPAGTGDQGWLRAFAAIVPPIVDSFAPEIIVSQNGVDSHLEDPLTHLTLTVDGHRSAYQAVHRLAHAHGGKLVAVGGGGYDLFDAVPRSWAILLAVLRDIPLDKNTPVPEAVLDYVRSLTGAVMTPVMTDGAEPWAKPIEQGFNPQHPVDAAIMETREAVFPFFGRDPEVDSWF